MLTLVYQDLKARRVLSRRRTNTSPSWDRVACGSEDITYAVELDHTDLEAMAIKAAGNKSGRSKRGPVLVRITSRKQAARP
jgi:hypothetical protein